MLMHGGIEVFRTKKFENVRLSYFIRTDDRVVAWQNVNYSSKNDALIFSSNNNDILIVSEQIQYFLL